jgi:hypothetical protein
MVNGVFDHHCAAGKVFGHFGALPGMCCIFRPCRGVCVGIRHVFTP